MSFNDVLRQVDGVDGESAGSSPAIGEGSDLWIAGDGAYFLDGVDTLVFGSDFIAAGPRSRPHAQLRDAGWIRRPRVTGPSTSRSSLITSQTMIPQTTTSQGSDLRRPARTLTGVGGRALRAGGA